jgi:ubiquinone/menaquinone biosynthesis C-methylase UbiE
MNHLTQVRGTEALERRLQVNRDYSSVNFDEWLLPRLNARRGDDVLDVGCGTGSQTVPLADAVGDSGSVSAVDISEQSIELLKRRLPTGARVQAVVGDMDDLAGIIARTFHVKSYDLAQSTYALYYAKNPLAVLEAMRVAVKPKGRCAIFVPNSPHGLVELASRFLTIPRLVHQALNTGPGIAEPYFKQHFTDVETHHFHNVVTVPDSSTIVDYYRQTNYHTPNAEQRIRELVEDAIAKTGSFSYEKNGYLVIGRRA